MRHLLSEVWWMENIYIATRRWMIPARTGCAGLRSCRKCPLRGRRLVNSLSRGVSWAELLYPKLETKLAKELGDAVLQKGRMSPLLGHHLPNVSEVTSHLNWAHRLFSVSAHEAEKKSLWLYLCWRQSRHPFSVNTLKYSIKINCLENTSFLLVDWWTGVSSLKQKKQQRLVSTLIYVNPLRKKIIQKLHLGSFFYSS